MRGFTWMLYRERMAARITTKSSASSRGDMTLLREIWHEEIEAALDGKKTAKAALDDAVRRGNVVLRDFERKID